MNLVFTGDVDLKTDMEGSGIKSSLSTMLLGYILPLGAKTGTRYILRRHDSGMMVVTGIDIVDSNQTSVVPVERSTLGTTTGITDILVGIPHVVATDPAAIALYKHTATASLITPSVSSLTGAPTLE